MISPLNIRFTRNIESQPLAAGILTTPVGLVLSNVSPPMVIEKLESSHKVIKRSGPEMFSIRISSTGMMESHPLEAGSIPIPVRLSSLKVWLSNTSWVPSPLQISIFTGLPIISGSISTLTMRMLSQPLDAALIKVSLPLRFVSEYVIILMVVS